MRVHSLTIAILLTVVSVALAEDKAAKVVKIPKNVEIYLTALGDQIEDAIIAAPKVQKQKRDKVETQLADARRELAGIRRKRFSKRAVKVRVMKKQNQRISALKRKIEKLRSADPLPELTDCAVWHRLADPKIGSIGRWHPRQIFTVSQVIDENNMLVRRGSATFWFEGFSTEGLVDDSTISATMTTVVAGTKKYTTVLGGSRTVFVFKPIDVSPYVEPFFAEYLGGRLAKIVKFRRAK